MIPPIRSSRACRTARSQPRNPAATLAMPRSNATLASPRAQRLPWELRYPSLAVRPLLRESGTTLGVKGSALRLKLKKVDRLGPRTAIRRDDILTFTFGLACILTNVFMIYNSTYSMRRSLSHFLLLSSICIDPTTFNIPLGHSALLL